MANYYLDCIILAKTNHMTKPNFSGAGSKFCLHEKNCKVTWQRPGGVNNLTVYTTYHNVEHNGQHVVSIR